MAFSLRSSGRSNYAYAVARVQAKRSKLIPAGEYAKVLKMDVAEITRFIEESAYKTEVDELASRFTGLDLLEAALTVNEERTYQSVRQMVSGPGGELVALFLGRYLVEDVKTVLRGKTAGATRDELLKELLLEDLDTFGMFQPLLSDDVQGVEGVMAAMESQGGAAREWAHVLRKVPPGSSLARYEDALDKAQYGRLLASLEASDQVGAPQVLEFVRREVDTVNLLNAARWVAAKETGDFSAFVIPGGKHLKVAQVMALARAGSLDAFAEALKESKLYDQVKDGLEAARASGRLAPFQAAVWRAHMADLDKLAHIHPLSIVPILVFLIRKHREVVTLRAIARGKAAGLSEARLGELVL